MDRYIGTKIVLAEPMDSDAFQAQVRPIPGMPVGPPTAPGYRIRYEDNYISWSPADVFERCYRRVSDDEWLLLNDDGAAPPTQERF